MIVFFAITNFRSFKDRTEFSMVAGNYKRFQDHILPDSDPGLLKISSMYGNNGAGKSNLIIALETLKDIVCNKKTFSEFTMPYFRLNDENKDKPTTFEIDFIINNNRYSYLISIHKGKILTEWLYKVLDNRNNKLEVIFERNLQEGRTSLMLGSHKQSRKEKIRSEIYAEELDIKGNIPFLYYGADKQLEVLQEPYKWFDDYLQIVRPEYINPSLIQNFDQNKNFKKLANVILKCLNIGVDEINVEKVPLDEFFGIGDEAKKQHIIDVLTNTDSLGITFNKGEQVYSVYKENDENFTVARLVSVHQTSNRPIQFELNEESTGTKKIIDILPAIILAITEGSVFIVDEIESSIHPHVIRELIRLFLGAPDSKGQLIFSTHECNLLDLDLLRQDEIWFAEKDDEGSSHIYSLSDFKPRYDKDIRKGYLEGKFSAIPFFTEPSNLNWNDDAK